MLCDWHRKGKPPGATSRFFVDGCPRCLEKLAAGLCERTDPTPRELFVRFYKSKIRRSDFRGLRGAR
jgi:hypothetical protein